MTVFGVPIYLHASWLIIFALITLSLIAQFAQRNPHWDDSKRVTLGLVTSILFFASVVFHELSHSFVATRYKIPVQSITLFVFGGLARITREPDNPRQEFNIAIAGPLSSFFLAGCFYLLTRLFHGDDVVVASATLLWQINLALAVFNLVPGFPLDGGRILRGIAWGITGDFTRATVIASNAGKFFAYALIFYGIWIIFHGNLVGGIWSVFIGWFLLSAAQEIYAQVAIRNTLTGVRAGDVMTKDVPSVPRDSSIEEYIHEIMRTGAKTHIVTSGDTPVGLITLDAARSVPRDEWASTSVQAVMLLFDRIQSAKPDDPVLSLLERMQTQDISVMPVVSDGHIVGMLSRDTILHVLQTRLQMRHLAHQ